MIELRETLAGARHRLVGALKGRALFHQGGPAEALYGVQRGCIRLEIEGEDGQRDVVSFLFPGDVVCAGFDTHWASAYAVTDCVLAVFSLQNLWDHVSRDPEAAHGLLQSADARLVDVAQHIALLSHANAEARLRWFLGWIAPRTALGDAAGSFQLPMGRRDIADFLGIAPETVSRTLKELITTGELRRLGGRRCVFRPRHSHWSTGPAVAECQPAF